MVKIRKKNTKIKINAQNQTFKKSKNTWKKKGGVSTRHVTNTLGSFCPSFFRGVFSPRKTNNIFFLVKLSIFFSSESREGPPELRGGFFLHRFLMCFSLSYLKEIFSSRKYGKENLKTVYVSFFYSLEVFPLPPPKEIFLERELGLLLVLTLTF